MSEDKDVWPWGMPVGVPPDMVGTLAVRVVRDVVRALGLDLEHAKVADIAPAVDALRRRIAEFEAAARWIPVGERLPEQHATVLACGPMDDPIWVATYSSRPGPTFRGQISCDWWGEGGRPLHVTHWRPLPAGPEEPPT